MRLVRFALALAALIACAAPAAAQVSTDEMRAQIEQLHGFSAEFATAFDEITAAMRYGDPVTVADYGAYPLELAANGELYDLLAAQDLVDNWDSLLLPQTTQAIADQDYGDLIVTSDGVGFANGAMWMNFVCDDNSCSSGNWRITRITN
ncbi:MAG: hypothetical protein ACOH2M_30430 [Cypionkella sp.]